MQKENKEQQNNKLALIAFALYIIKTILVPLKSNLSFVAKDLSGSIKKDSYKAIVIVLSSVFIFFLAVIFWVSLGAGLIIYLLSGSGAVLQIWGYVLLFELLSVFALALLVFLLKRSFRTKEAIERARKLLLKK